MKVLDFCALTAALVRKIGQQGSLVVAEGLDAGVGDAADRVGTAALSAARNLDVPYLLQFGKLDAEVAGCRIREPLEVHEVGVVQRI